jgi:hypothetical protein
LTEILETIFGWMDFDPMDGFDPMDLTDGKKKIFFFFEHVNQGHVATKRRPLRNTTFE